MIRVVTARARSEYLRRCLPGAVFWKELRLASRLRRTYVLRAAYALCIAVVVANEYRHFKFPAQGLAGDLVVLQFAALLILAAVRPLRAIQDEVNHRTLPALMAAPLSGFQILAGKLGQHLISAALLAGVAFPCLLAIRVFGGVPFEFVAAGTAVALAATTAVAAVSLWVGLYVRGLFSGLVAVACALPVVFFLAPMALLLAADEAGLPSFGVLERLECWNPILALDLLVEDLRNPRAGTTGTCPWIVHCLCMTALTILFVVLGACRVRATAARRIEHRSLVRRACEALYRLRGRLVRRSPAARSSAVRGDPVFWHERVRLRIHRRGVGILAATAVTAVVVLYLLGEESRELALAPCMLLLAAGTFQALFVAAGAIAEEKAAGTWLLVLGTGRSSLQVAAGKLHGALHATAPVWFALGACATVAAAVGHIASIALPLLCLVCMGSALCAAGVGLYFSARLKSTVAALFAGLAVVAVLWGGVPFACSTYGLLVNDAASLRVSTFAGNFIPVLQAKALLGESWQGLLYGPRILPRDRMFDWEGLRLGVAASIAIVTGTALIHALVGAIFFWRTVTRLRR